MSTKTVSETSAAVIETRDQLIGYFAGGEKPAERWRIGTEHEKFVFRTSDHRAPSYDEPGGIRDLLMALTEFGWRPVEEGGKVIALTGASPQGMEAMVGALRDPDQQPRIQGDVALLSGGRVEAFRISRDYAVGSLPIWLWPQLYLGHRPDLILALLVGAALLLAIPAYWAMRRRAATRLRARHP